MKQIITIIAIIISISATAQTEKQDTTKLISGTLYSIKWEDTSVSRTITYDDERCRQTYWPLVFEECPQNPMHCRSCGKEIKLGESFCHLVVKQVDNVKYVDWIHIRCANRRIH